MTKFTLLLLLSLIACSFSSSLLYSPKIVDVGEEKIGENKIALGQYKKFRLVLTPLDDVKTIKKAQAILNYSTVSSDIMVIPNQIHINTHVSLTYDFYVGLSCSKDYLEDVELNLEIINGSGDETDADAFEDLEKPKVSFIDKKYAINILSASSYLPSDSYGIYRVDETIQNVDDITISFKRQSTDSTISVETGTFPAFTGVPRTHNNEDFTGIIKVKPGKRTTDEQKFSINLDEGSQKCFKPAEDTFDFTVQETKLAQFTQTTKTNILKSISLISGKPLNTIAFTIKAMSYPAMLSCVMTRKADFPSEDDIRNRKVIEDENTRLFQRFLEDEEVKEVVFDNMSRLGGYKAKCVIDNTALEEDDKRSFVFTLGNFEGADKQMVFMKEENTPIFGNCMTWVFDRAPASDFKKQMDYYCNDYFSQKFNPDMKKQWSDNGCYVCNMMSKSLLPGDYTYGVCLESTTTCNSDFQEKSKDAFFEFGSTINTIEQIRAVITGMENVGLERYKIDYDDAYPDPTEIKISKVSLDETKITVNIKNENYQSVGCRIKQIDDEKFADVKLDDFITTGQEVILYPLLYSPEGVNVDLIYKDEGYDDLITNIILSCYYLPGTSYYSHINPPFVGYTFLKSEKLPTPYTPKAKPECKDKTTIECIGIIPNDPPEWKLYNPREDNDNDYKFFANLTDEEQRQKIQIETEHFVQLIKPKMIVDQLGYLSELLYRRNCDKSVNYEQCAIDKVNTVKTIVDTLGKDDIFHIPASKLFEYINNTVITDKGEFVQIFAQDLFALTNNFEAVIDIETFEKIYAYLQVIISNQEAFYDYLDTSLPEEQTVNVINNIAGSCVNLLDSFPYLEANKAITANENGLIVDEHLENLKALLHQALIPFFSTSQHTFSFDSFHWKYDRKGLTAPYLYEDDWGNEVFFDSLNIKVYYREKLFNSVQGAKIATIFAYETYPSVSNFNTKVSKHFIGMKLYDMNYNQIRVTNLKNEIRPVVTYSLKHEGSDFLMCKLLEANAKKYNIDEVSTKSKLDEYKFAYINCTMSELADVSIGEIQREGTVEKKYTSEFVPEDGEKNVIKKGIYKKFNFVLKPKNKLIKKKQAVLRFVPNEENDIKVIPSETVINTHQSLTYPIYVGVSCENTKIVTGQDYTVKFKIVNGIEWNQDADEFEEPSQFIVKFNDETEDLFVSSASQVLPTDCEGIYRVGEYIHNVDKFTVSFDLGPEEQRNFTNFTAVPKEFDEFKGERSNNDEQFSGRLFIGYNEAGESRKSENQEVKVLVENNKCIKPNPEKFTFTIKETKLATFKSKTTRSNILKSINSVKPDTYNSFGFTLKTYVYPVMITCVAYRDSMLYYTDEALRKVESVIQDENLRIYQRFVDDEEEKTVMFENMNRLGGFRARCILDNSAVNENEKDQFAFNIGQFEEADKNIPLMPEANTPIYGNCITWSFDENSKQDEFNKVMEYYCNDYFSAMYNPDGSKSWLENGCYNCYNREGGLIENAVSSGICLESSVTCPSDFPRNSTQDFTEFANKISTSEQIKKLIPSTMRVKVQYSYIESDNDYPDTSAIIIYRKELEKDHLTIQLQSTDDQPIECVISPVKYIKFTDIQTDDFIKTGTIVRLYPYEISQSITLEFPDREEGFDDLIYNVVLSCYNLPGTNYNAHITKPFVGYTFLKHEYMDDPYVDERKEPCTDTTSLECINRKPHQAPKWLGDNPKEDNENDVTYFNKLTNAEQVYKIDLELGYFLETGYPKNVADELGYISELLTKRECDATNNYRQCISDKLHAIENITDTLAIYIPKGIMNVYNDTKMTNATEYSLIMAQSLFALSNNFEVIRTEKLYNTVYGYIEEMINHTQEIFDKFELYIPDEQKVNFINYLTASALNLYDSLLYLKANNVTDIDGKMAKITSIVKSSLMNLFQTDSKYFSYETFHFKYNRKVSKELNDDWNNEIYFDSLNIKAVFREALFEMKEADIITAFSYDSFPYIDITNPNVSKHFVGFEMYKYNFDDNSYTEVKSGSVKKDYKPVVTFPAKENEQWKLCRTYDMKTKGITTDNVETKVIKDKYGNVFVECYLDQFGLVSIGIEEPKSEKWKVVLIVIGSIVILAIIITLIILLLKKRKEDNTRISKIIDSTSPLMGINP